METYYYIPLLLLKLKHQYQTIYKPVMAYCVLVALALSFNGNVPFLLDGFIGNDCNFVEVVLKVQFGARERVSMVMEGYFLLWYLCVCVCEW